MKTLQSYGIGATALAAIVSVFAFAPSGGLAQPANPLARFTLAPDAAKIARTTDEISLDTARRIADTCLKFAADHNVRVSVFVLNPGGSVVFSERMDGQQPVNIDTGLMKAKGALYMRDSTHVWANRVIQNPGFGLVMQDLKVYTVSGGLPIMVGDQMIGAIGVGGSNVDEECAQAGLEAVIGPQPPLAPRLQPNGQPAPPPANLAR